MGAHAIYGGQDTSDWDVGWESADDAAPAYEDDVARPGRWELVSLVVLVVSGIGLPLIGWPVGLALVWLSDAWSDQDKRIAAWSGVCAALWAALASFFLGGLVPFGMGPLAVLVIFGGAIAALVSAVWLTWRAFALA